MPYPKHLLNDNETVRVDMKPHWWFFVQYIMSGFILFGLVIFYVVSRGKINANVGVISASIETIFGFVILGLILFWLLGLVVRYLYWKFTIFVVTSDRVIFRTGIIAKRGSEIPLENISNINFNQKIIERLVGCGTLELESAGLKDDLNFTHIRNPDLVQREIYVMMEDNVKRTARYSSDGMVEKMEDVIQSTEYNPERPGAGSGDIISQIESLAKLRDQNIISDEEYEAKKRQLLDRM